MSCQEVTGTATLCALPYQRFPVGRCAGTHAPTGSGWTRTGRTVIQRWFGDRITFTPHRNEVSDEIDGYELESGAALLTPIRSTYRVLRTREHANMAAAPLANRPAVAGVRDLDRWEVSRPGYL